MTLPHYLIALAGAAAVGALEAGEAHEVTVLHDEDCPHLTGRGPCNCEPTLEVRRHKVDQEETHE